MNNTVKNILKILLIGLAATAVRIIGQLSIPESSEQTILAPSIFAKNGWIVTGAHFRLRRGTAETERALFEEYQQRRREKQPLNLPSAGSVFKRPSGHFAGALIEQAGLKGAAVGGAQVSKLHAGFIVNTGGATAADVLALIERIKKDVRQAFGVSLEEELKVIGE